eukprot:gene7288-12985_t
MNTGQLSKSVEYPIKIFTADSIGNDYIRVRHRKSNVGNFSSSWSGMIRNLKEGDTAKSIPVPVLTVINSTAITATLFSVPYLPPLDGWTYIPDHEIRYYEDGNATNYRTITVTGSLPQTRMVSGLKKYTAYRFYALYFGTINGSSQNIMSESSLQKTDQDIPEAAPESPVAIKNSSTSILFSWRPLSDEKLWNGIPLFYKVQYRERTDGSSWMTTDRMADVNSYLAVGLKKYTNYEFKVAGMTTKGAGVFTMAIEERTDEDIPTAAPVSFHIAGSKGSAMLSWQGIPVEHRNGIVRGYVIHFKIGNKDTKWNETISTALNTTVNGLKKNEHYEFKIAGKTDKGIGTFGKSLKFSTYETNQVDKEAPSAFITNIKFTNMALVKHLSKVVQVTSTEECFNVCKNCFEAGSGCRCASINIKRAAATSIWGCEINEESKEAFPCDFVATEGSQYYEVS